MQWPFAARSSRSTKPTPLACRLAPWHGARMTVAASPCTGVCRIDEPSGWCIGCARSLAEIAAWPTAGHEDRTRIRAALPDRLEKLKAIGAAFEFRTAHGSECDID